MKKYYLYIDGETKGPFFLTDLPEQGATLQTYVWYKGLDGWTHIADVPDVARVIENASEPQPPMFQPEQFYSSQNSDACGTFPRTPGDNDLYPRPNNYLAESILALLFCFPLAIVAIMKARKVNKLYDNGDYNRAYIASTEARNWFIAAIAVGLLYLFFLMVL